MEEAKKRNPKILLEGLQWGAPGWIGNGTFYSQDNINFIISFIQAAKRHHGLEMDYQGVRNEVRYDPAWIKRLRQALDDNGLRRVKIVAADLWPPEDQWVIAQEMAKDAGLNGAVAVLNAHVPEMVNFRTPPEARRLNKPLWDGEAHAYGGDWYAAADYARYNRAYPLGQITKIISWSLITAYPDFLVAPASGPMKANTPWSGHYEVQPPLWMMAHTTQFAEPGWTYLDRTCRFFNSEGGLGAGWSLNALKSPTTDDYSLIIETMDAKEPWTLRCRLSEDLSTRDLAVWRSVFNQELFIRQDDAPVRNREFRLTVIPNAIYSLTTTRGQQKGRSAHAVPDPKPFPFPFATDFQHDPVGGPAKYLCDQHGTFEVAPRPDGQGQCLVQTMTRQGITWRGGYSFAQTIVGDIGWSDYRVSVEAMLPEQGSLMLWGRMNRFGWEDGAPFAADQFEVKDDGRWTLKAGAQVLASGQVAPLGHNWHGLGLAFRGTEITALIRSASLGQSKRCLLPNRSGGLGHRLEPGLFRQSEHLPRSLSDRRPVTARFMAPAYVIDVEAIVAAFEHGLVFDRADIDRLIDTNRDFMWNQEVPGAKFQRIDGGQPDPRWRNNPGVLWTALVPYDAALRKIFLANHRPDSWGGLSLTPWFLSLSPPA